MAIDCIDVHTHTHFVPEKFPAYTCVSTDTPWPSMLDAKPCHKHVLISGKQYWTVSDGCWNASRRLSDMPIMGVTHQAISPMPELLSYWLPLADARTLIRYINDELAVLIDQDRSRFFGLGGVPLQDLDAALTELHYVIDELGFSGVEIGSNVNAVSIGIDAQDDLILFSYSGRARNRSCRSGANRFLEYGLGASFSNNGRANVMNTSIRIMTTESHNIRIPPLS